MSRRPMSRSFQEWRGADGQKIRPQPADHHHRHHVHRRGEQARNDAGDEELADVLLGDDAVDREHRRRRQHGAERTAGGNHAGGEGLRIVVAAHLRIGDGRERRGGRHRRAGNRGKAGAGGDGGDAEPAPEMSDEGIGGAEQFAAHAGIRHERAHEQEHRDDAEGVVGHRAHRGVADDLQRRSAADQISRSRSRRRAPSPCRPARAAASARTARRNRGWRRRRCSSRLIRPA